MQQQEEAERTKTHLEAMDKHEEQCLPHSRRLQHDLDSSLSGMLNKNGRRNRHRNGLGDPVLLTLSTVIRHPIIRRSVFTYCTP